jgi:catechol-2,3-dioxygenase
VSQQLSHVALTVDPGVLDGEPRTQLLEFYGEVLGWSENTGLAIPGERILLRVPGDEQYVTIRASQDPMTTSGYEHLGVEVSSRAELEEVHARASAAASRFEGAEVEPVRVRYGGTLHTFRFRYVLPLSIEMQFIDRETRS